MASTIARKLFGAPGSLRRYLCWGILFWGGICTAIYYGLITWIADMALWKTILAPAACFTVAGILWALVAWLVRPRRYRGHREPE